MANAKFVYLVNPTTNSHIMTSGHLDFNSNTFFIWLSLQYSLTGQKDTSFEESPEHVQISMQYDLLLRPFHPADQMVLNFQGQIGMLSRAFGNP